MADSYIRVPADSTGKYSQTFNNTVGGTSVHAQAVALVRTSDNAPLDPVSGIGLPVAGDIAHDATDSGAPTKMGGYAKDTAPTAVSAGDRVNAWFDLNGRLVVNAAGFVAHDAADSGNPVKVGGKYNNSLTAVATGDRVDLQMDSLGAVYVNVEGRRATYVASTASFALEGTPTDFFEIKNSAGTAKVIVTRIGFSGYAGTAITTPLFVIKRSTLNTGGTAVGATEFPHDSNDASVTGVVQHYTADPTTGTGVGNVRSRMVTLYTAASPLTPDEVVFTFVGDGQKGILLRSNESLVLNFGGATIASGTAVCWVEWIEEGTP